MSEPHALSPQDADAIERLVEASMPGLMLALVFVAVCVAIVVTLNAVAWLRARSPVERILRERRFG